MAAGQEASGAFSTQMIDDASAISYARGLIAVPDARATTTLVNNTSVTVAASASLASGQNINIGAFTGNLKDTATGVGHGYELYAIPVTDGHSNPTASAPSTFTCSSAGIQ